MQKRGNKISKTYTNTKHSVRKAQLPFVDLPTAIPTQITKKLYDKIRHLCRVIDKVEWSGAIFYEIIGTFHKPDEMSIIVHDLIPLDKGSTSFTSYEFDERIIEYGMEKGYLMNNYKIGHIHSHHSMKTFFSGTDNEEVNENSEFQNPYLSIIVNNKGNYSAKIAFRGTASTDTNSYEYLDTDGKKRRKKIVRDKEVVITYPCKCINPTSGDDEFEKQIKEICKPKKLPIVGYNPSYKMYYQHQLDYNPFRDEDDDFGLDLGGDDLEENFLTFALMNGAIGVSHVMEFDRAVQTLSVGVKQQGLKLGSYVEEVYNNFPDLVDEYYGTMGDDKDAYASLLYNNLLDRLEKSSHWVSEELYSLFKEYI